MRLTAILLAALLSVTVASAQTPAPPDRYAAIPQVTDDAGFPRIGFPSAPVSVTLFLSFDDPASIAWYATTYERLYNRLRAGEIRILYVPLAERGAIPGGRTAMRAALCAADQGAFWRYFDAQFAALVADSAPALEAARVLALIGGLGIDRGRWDACMLGSRPDSILREGERALSELAFFTATPYILVNGDPTLPDGASLESVIRAAVSANATAISQAIRATATPTPEGLTLVEPLTGEQIPPPITLTLPNDWGYAYDGLIIQDIDGLRAIPFAVYQGDVPGGTGTIVVLWGFPNLVGVSPADIANAEPNLWADGLRLLRLAVIEEGCNIGTDLRREYSVGGLAATGTQFSAVNCPELPDTRGWFAGLQAQNLNFVFYIFTTPITALDGAAPTLQRILDSVAFQPLDTIQIPPTAALPPPPP
jgi:protein-disulfide isomerase